MSLFHRRRTAATDDRPSPAGLVEVAAAQGWQPAGGQPFDGHLETAVHTISLAMYHIHRHEAPLKGVTRIGETVFTDAFRANIDGRAVVVSNAWTNIQSEIRHSDVVWAGAAVCTAELPTVLPYASVRPRSADPMPGTPRPTGNAVFDDRFIVAGTPEGVGAEIGEILTAQVQQLMMAREDWFFQFERYMLGCISKGPFHSAEEVRQRMDQVLAIVAAIPASIVPDHVDHTEDDLIARINKLTSLEDAMMMLQQLTPEDRGRLAQSDSPLAAFADVTTSQEAMARFRDLDQPRRLQLMAMFMRVKDSSRGA